MKELSSTVHQKPACLKSLLRFNHLVYGIVLTQVNMSKILRKINSKRVLSLGEIATTPITADYQAVQSQLAIYVIRKFKIWKVAKKSMTNGSSVIKVKGNY